MPRTMRRITCQVQLSRLRPGCLTLALLLGACTSLAPPYERPGLPVQDQYPGSAAAVPVAAGTASAATAWRDYFIDARLQSLISQALTHNRDLRAAVLRVEAARALYGIERAGQFPAIGAGGAASRSRTPADLSLTGQSASAQQYQAGLNLTAWEVDFWGRVRNLKDAALENFLASDSARRALAASLVAEVANGYLVLLELNERVGLARQTIASHEASLALFKRRYAVGATSQLDVVQVQALLTQAQVLDAELEQARARQANALALLVGGPVDLPAAATPMDDRALLREVRAGLPSELLVDRPDIIAAEQRLKAAHANIGAARAAFFPRVTLTGSLGSASAELGRLFAPGSGAWSFLPSISLPIFDAGLRRANLDLAEVRRDMAVVDYEKTIQTAFREVSDALAARQWLDRQVGYQEAMLAAQAERARLAQLRYDSGATAYLEVLDAQRDLLSARQQLVQVRRARLTSRVSLYAALGGGAMHAPPQPPPTTEN